MLLYYIAEIATQKKTSPGSPNAVMKAKENPFTPAPGEPCTIAGVAQKKELTDGAKLEKLEWSGGTKKPRRNIECRASSSLLPRIGQRATASERATWLLVAVQLRAGAGRGLNNSRIIIYYVLKFSKPYHNHTFARNDERWRIHGSHWISQGSWCLII